MTSNVGLTTPRGSGTSGYVQRNLSLLRPRDSGYGNAPSYGAPGFEDGKDGFQQRQPDRKILEHDKRREIELQVLEERDRLEEENEAIDDDDDGDKNKEEKDGGEREKKVKLSEEEIEERSDALRARLTKELEDELAGRDPRRDGYGKRKQDNGDEDSGPKRRKQFKSYQVHELAEAKIQESERLRKALGIRAEGEEDLPRDDRRRYDRGGERYRDRDDRSDDRDRRHRDRGDRYDDRDQRYRDRDDPGDEDGIEEYRRRV